MKISDDLVWDARKEKDALLKRYALDEAKKLAYILANGDVSVRKTDDGTYKGKYFEYYLTEKTELDAYLSIISRLGNKSSTRYPIC